MCLVWRKSTLDSLYECGCPQTENALLWICSSHHWKYNMLKLVLLKAFCASAIQSDLNTRVLDTWSLLPWPSRQSVLKVRWQHSYWGLCSDTFSYQRVCISEFAWISGCVCIRLCMTFCLVLLVLFLFCLTVFLKLPLSGWYLSLQCFYKVIHHILFFILCLPFNLLTVQLTLPNQHFAVFTSV